jgi:CRP/FNR family transcriptional regulator, transcriptional activator FtrB
MAKITSLSLDIDQAEIGPLPQTYGGLHVFAAGRLAVRQPDWDIVRALPLFCDMNEENFNELTAAGVLQSFPPHEELITEGNFPDFLHILLQGSVEMFCTHDGHETTIDIMRPATTFILAAVIRDDVYLSSARTLTTAQIISIPARPLRDVFGRDFAFSRAVVNELAERYCTAVRSRKNEKLRSSAERLANWILRADAQQGNHRVIEVAFGKRTLAASLGMTPENLSRNLARLTRYGVRISGRDIFIEDFLALKRFAKPNTLIDG